MKKKLLVVLLALALMISMLSACAGTETAGESASPAGESAAPAESAPAESAPAEEEAPQVQWPEEPVTLTYWTHINNNMATDLDKAGENPVLQLAASDTNISLDIVGISRDAASEQFNLMIAGGEYTDLVNRFLTYYTGGADNAVKEEIILDLAPLVPEYAPNYYEKAQADEGFWHDCKTDTGVMATLYAMTTYADGGPISGGYIRQDWLDELGLESPVTYDEYHDVLSAFKNKYDCSSTLFLTEDIYPENYCMIAGYDVSSTFYFADDQIKYGPMEAGYEEYVTMMSQWYSEGLISSDFVSVAAGFMSPFKDYIASGDTGIWFTMARTDDSWDSLVGGDATKAISAVQDAVKNKDDQTHLGFAERLIGNDGISITTQCPEEYVNYALQYMDYWYSDEGIQLVNYGIEGQAFNYNDAGEPEYTDLINNNPDGLTKVQAQFDYCLIHLIPSANTAAESIVSEDHAIWGTNKDGSYELPTTLSMTAEESERYTALYNDISTHVQEMTARFITGEAELSEFQQFRQDLKDLGIDECMEIVQAEYDRYQER